MKKLFVILFAAVMALPSTARPQFLHYFGIKAGFVSSSQTLEHPIIDDSDFERRAGFAIGVFGELPLIAGFSISPQIEYAQRGFRDKIIVTIPENPDGVGSKTYKVDIDYLIIPVFLKYNADLAIGRISLEAGPRLDIKINMRSDFLWFDDYKNTIGLSFGAAYSPKLALPVSPFIEFAYHIDIDDAYDKAYYTEELGNYHIKIKNNAFNINLGVKF